MTAPGSTRQTGWVGWVAFAAIMLLMVGAFNVIDGFAALLKDDAFVNTGKGLLVFNLTAWGWILLLFGVVQILTGLALLQGATWARVIAVLVALVNAVGQLAFLSAYPIWSTVIIAVDIIVIWAVIVHGEEMREGI